ncbi:MAG: hypothetical protein R3A48_27070 [Polyangiales bacterium]
MATPHDKAAELARIEAIEAGDADGDALAAAWRDAPQFQLNLRTRLRRAVARSPSIPPRLAAAVIQKFPREIFENPALPLLLLESPDLLLRAPRRFWDAVFAAPELSPAMMPALVAACPSARLDRIARRPEFELADAQALLQRLRVTVLGVPGADLGLTDEQALSLCQQWHDASLDLDDAVVAALRRHVDDLSARVVLMRARQLSVSEVIQLGGDPRTQHYQESLALAGREDLPVEHLAALARNGYGQVRALVAANPATPVEAVVALIKDRDPHVSAAAMLCPRLPRAAFETFLKRGASRRRAVLALRPDLTADDYAALARAGEIDVRAAVAQNPHAPREVLALLANDLREEVRDALLENPALPPDLLAAQGDEATEATPAKPAKRAPKPSLLERARAILVGDTSGGERWEAVLSWVEAGGKAPGRVPLSPKDRKALLRGGLALLGEEPGDYDAARTRLLAALMESLGCLPELNSKMHRALRYGPAAPRVALAERWLARLMDAGYDEAEALSWLCYTPTASKLARDRGGMQTQLAREALSSRLDRVPALLASMPKGKPRTFFAQFVVGELATGEVKPDERVARLLALYQVDEIRGAMTVDLVRRVAISGGVAFVNALDAASPTLSKEFLKSVDLNYGWSVPREVIDRARAAQGLPLP